MFDQVIIVFTVCNIHLSLDIYVLFVLSYQLLFYSFGLPIVLMEKFRVLIDVGIVATHMNTLSPNLAESFYLVTHCSLQIKNKSDNSNLKLVNR